MKFKSIKKLFLYGTLAFAILLTGCCSPSPTAIYPVKDIPEEFKSAPVNTLEVTNTVYTDNAIQDNITDKMNSILADKTFNVYYDNSGGCFKNYTSVSKGLMLDAFQKTMRSFHSVFDCAYSYKTFTTQPSDKEVLVSGEPKLVWKKFSGNLFDEYMRKSVYTSSFYGDYDPNKPPLIMWVDEVEKHTRDNKKAIDVFISDLNEQNGNLAEPGKLINKLLKDSDGTKDFLIISYVLPYTGSISGYSTEIDGNSDNKDYSVTIKGVVDRHYYVLAFGDRLTLQAFKAKVAEGFNELEENYGLNLQMNSFQYYDIFYNETDVVTLDKSGNIIEDSEFIANNPIELTPLDKNGAPIDFNSAYEPVQNEEEKKDSDDIFGDVKTNKTEQSNGINLSPLIDLSPYLSELPQGQSFAFHYDMPIAGDNGWGASVVLENTGLYEFDAASAVSYIYIPDSAKKDDLFADSENSKSGWVKLEGNDYGITVEVDQGKLKVSSEDMLSAQEEGKFPIVMVSVPVILPYSVETSSFVIKKTNGDFIEWVDSCKVPEPVKKNYERLTRTLNFDKFIDMITDGYKNISEEGQRSPTEQSDEPVMKTAQAGRVNLIFAAKNG